MPSGFFQNARNFQITGGTFNQVQGDQYNYNYTTIIQAKEEEPSEFDEYFKVKLGGIFKLRDVGSSAYPRQWSDNWDVKAPPRADRTICTARLLEQPGMVFTMLQYSGPDARKAFLEDFRMLSNILTSNASQIYGYSKSKIPSLILYNDLVPTSQLTLEQNVGWIHLMYLSSVAFQLGCKSVDELWIDTGRGTLCRGPPGPAFHGYRVHPWFGKLELPLTAEPLQEDVLLRLAASRKSKKADGSVIGGLGRGEYVSVRVSQPTVFSTLTNSPIALANNTWTSETIHTSEQKLLENGLTRFRLTGTPQYVALQWNGMTKYAWQSQAWRIFHNCGVNLEDDLSVYNVVLCRAGLEAGELVLPSEAQLEQQSQQPIYLFVRSPPSDLINHNTSSLHYWSFHEEGHSPLSRDTCRDLGLPNELDFMRRLDESFSLFNKEYQCIHQYQVLRGFDPSTTDFARHLGYDDNIFQPVNDSD